MHIAKMTPHICQPSDVPRIELCARLCCEEHGEARVGGKLNWPHYRNFWMDLIERGDGIIFYHENEEREMVGGFGGGCFTEPITGALRAAQLFHYYRPEWRGKVSVRGLLRAFEQWAKGRGCMNITMPVLDTNNQKIRPFLTVLGYSQQQECWIKRLQ